MPEISNQMTAAGDGSVRYFLLVEGLDGGSTATGYENAFDISSATLDVERINARMDFDDLALTLAPGSNADELIRLLATGLHVPKVQLVEARQNAQGVWVTLNDYRFGDVQLTGFGLNDSSASALSLAFGEFEQTVRGETFGWDIGLGGPLTGGIGTPTTPTENPLPTLTGVEWFLTLEGVDGGGPNGAFSLSGFDFDMAMVIANGGGGGGGSGKATFDPLSMILELGSASEEILEYVASGKMLKAAQIVGLTESGAKTAFDLRLADVTIAAADLHSKATDAVTLSYNAFSLTTLDKAGAAETFGWNLKTLGSSTTPLVAATGLDEDALNGGDTAWRMVIDGLNGGGTDNDFYGAFGIVDFAFGASNNVAPGAGGGSGSGKAEFSALTVTFGAGTALDELLDLLANGLHLERGVRITGDVTADGKTHADGYDLRLNDATVTSIVQLANGNITATFDFGAYSLTTENADGDRETSGWSLADGGKVSTDLIGAVGSEEMFLAGPGKPSNYYLVIEGMDGGVDAAKFAQAFAVSSFSWDAFNAASGGGGGGGVGKVDFSALSVELDLGSATTALLDRWRSGAQFSVQLVGTDPSQKSAVIYDLRLGEAALTRLEQNQKAHDVLTFDYEQFSLATGRGASREVFGFDVDTGTAIDELDAPAADDQSGRAAEKMDYRFILDGVDGGGPNGAFLIDNFSLDLIAKNAESSSITLTLDIGTAADDLLPFMARSKSIALARLIGDETGKGGMDAAYDLRLGRIFITNLEQNSQGKDVLTLSFDQASLSTKDDKGRIRTEGFDGNNGDPGLLLPASGGKEDGQGGMAMDYWLTIDGLNSGEKTKGHVGAFALDSFDFDIPTDGVSPGGDVGRAYPQPIVALLEAGFAANELLEMIGDDGVASSASIVGTASRGARKGDIFFEIRLEDVHVSQFSQGDDGDSLTLAYDAMSITTWNARGKSETYGYNVASPGELDHVIAVPVVGEL